MDEFQIPLFGGDATVREVLSVVDDGWISVAGPPGQNLPALISLGALRTEPAVDVSLRSLVDDQSATYVVSAEPRSFATLELVRDDAAWERAIIVLGAASDMPDTCPTCNTRGHGPPCPLLP